MTDSTRNVLPEPIVVPGREENLDEMLSREWLVNNRRGSYASGSVTGGLTRRYHGLLIAATHPPVGRLATLATVMERVETDGDTLELATNEFDGTFSPRGVTHLREFRNDVAATFVFDLPAGTLTKEVLLHESENIVAVRYTLQGGSAVLWAFPFVAMRSFHHLRSMDEPSDITFRHTDSGVMVRDAYNGDLPELHLAGGNAEFRAQPDWWKRFRYRTDLLRGQDGHEDLYTPGGFCIELADGDTWQLTAGLAPEPAMDFDRQFSARRERLSSLSSSLGDDADELTRRLAVAADAFVVQRNFPGPEQGRSETILAGYHWFADWGRDAFIALPGLLLETGRHEQARHVLRTFASHIRNGMIPNRFDDYEPTAHYNSIDASLWFCIAAERFMAATNDQEFWGKVLRPAMHTLLSAYRDGTDFGIHAEDDLLITGGSPDTQLTWMDAKLGDEAVTPRHGKAVEINALWYCANRILAERCAEASPDLAAEYSAQADRIAASFAGVFWNPDTGCLYDCITHGRPDGSVRPNQIFAVSLPYSPLEAKQQRAVVKTVRNQLLTPRGLRTLSPNDPRYRAKYGMSWESRDRAYHQGTVWAWLIGPFVEAHLKVHGRDRRAVAEARTWLDDFAPHLREAGLGTVSEIFDGDPPHAPRGCIAQAWSVAELLRARRLVTRAEGGE